MKKIIFAFCTVGFLLTLSSHAIATNKYIERCGICVPSKTIKPSKKGEIIKECLLRECTNSDPKETQKSEDGKVFLHIKIFGFFRSILSNKGLMVYREYEDKPGNFSLTPWEKIPPK